MQIFRSKNDYCNYNHKIIQNERGKHESEKENISYSVTVKYYRPYRKYYLIIPKRYLDNESILIKDKNDIFSKGKILTFTSNKYIINQKYKRYFKFDAVVDSQEEDFWNYRKVYAILVPIKERYRYKFSRDLVGNFTVQERNGDLTYDRMDEALDEFNNGICCSKNLEKYILGHDIIYKRDMNELFNARRYYSSFLPDYFRLNDFDKTKINKIFKNEMTTIKIKDGTSHKLLCLIINSIYQKRLYPEDKILICSSSNSSADEITVELLDMISHMKTKNLKLLRIYAKNQEIIKRPKIPDNIIYHKLKLKLKNKNNNFGRRNLLIENSDIIISTCVNSYCDELINYNFPFVIIVDADNSNENENLIPITLNAQHVVLIAYEESQSGYNNLYQRMKSIFPNNHLNF